VRLSAGGVRVEVLELEVDEVTGRAKVTAYPLMRTDAGLHIELKGRSRETESLDVKLP
jgi:hypothetical protein